MENKEFFAALTDLVKEKGISEEAFIQTLENALASAYKKQFDGGAEIAVSLDAEKGTIEFRATRYIVEVVEDKDKEISIEDAQELNPDYKVGDTIVKTFIPKNFGRIAAQTAKRYILTVHVFQCPLGSGLAYERFILLGLLIGISLAYIVYFVVLVEENEVHCSNGRVDRFFVPFCLMASDIRDIMAHFPQISVGHNVGLANP